MFLVIQPSVIDHDKQTCIAQTTQVKNIIDYRVSSLATNTKAYATWDDTYKFALDQNSQYIDINYDNNAFDYLHLNLVAIVNNQSDLIYYQTYDLNDSEKTLTPQNTLSFLSAEDLWDFRSINDTNVGIAVIDHQPLMITSAPIITSESKGPIVGGLLFGRYIDSIEVQALTTLTGINFTLTETIDFSDSETLSKLVSGEATIVVKTDSDFMESGYALIRDIEGEPGFVLRVNTERSSYQTGLYLQNLLILVAIVISAGFAAIIFVFMERNIVKPLTKMAGYVEEISLNPNFSPPKDDAVTEEFAVLTDAVENTLKRKLEGMNEVSRMVAHDLRNPLAGIMYSTYILKKHYGNQLDSEGHAVLGRIDDSIRYANNIVQNLLDYSSEIKLDRIQVLAKELVDQTLSKLILPEGVTVVNEVRAADRVYVDPNKIERVFTNLVGNAFDAMPDGGTLKVTSSCRDGFVRFDFADSGVGLSNEALANLWKPFFTTKAKGMGIGLSICKRIVDAHGGKIEVQSRPGQGACFSVYLPTDKGN
jgi:signal transduction histidine kinase